ncbi:hypothetical protein H2198_000495 [Neophaeococcomyces mojaviensis]|uniref:Uncharacterized protein n=1 Tax=Neophaeococcomyces mojaviensis TaxID=3383035 RepID=A0ACC3AK32_9EURO|nr:hypothetical protein H2198_000495 [Knufia sp. JES_112]
MGDAGPPTPIPLPQDIHAGAQIPQGAVRDIHVLVTGFGAFKSFVNNPSYLIASSLPKELDPLLPQPLKAPPATTPASTQHTQHPLAALLGRSLAPPSSDHELTEVEQPLRPPNNQPYRIHVHTYPAPVHVAYAPTSTLITSLLNQSTNTPFYVNFDYVLHIGLASGRDSYTLETNAHRDAYDIKDVDSQDGFLPGEKIWKSLTPPIPERLDVGWLATDVLSRWEAEVERRQDVLEKEMDRMLDELSKGNLRVREQLLNTGTLGGRVVGRYTREQYIRRSRRAVVKLSRDAGRYLCEFILMCSLVYRYRDGRGDFGIEDEVNNAEQAGADVDVKAVPRRLRDRPSEKVGKVAFLHVPNGTEPDDIARGRMVAESAIQAVVASWEAGYRNPNVYASQEAAAAEATDHLRGDSSSQTPLQRDATLHMTMHLADRPEPSAAFETRGTGDS